MPGTTVEIAIEEGGNTHPKVMIFEVRIDVCDGERNRADA